ncbi:lipocalin-15-like isoform X1 [Cervus elaphus]|uniref:lipocalin-15-like isoform X1 n=1 Tax=Cervus elaphus TaxID=9860 RepID=UPI001CC3233E|nr:lipocalin-15-like isoform X1 [Cervus elaphus]
MGPTLLSCVLLLLWLSSARADVLVQPDFDASKFSGLWYVVSMVSDCKVFLGKKDHLLMSTRDIKASAGGNLSVHMEFPREDGCNQVDAEYLRVGSQGHFQVPALGYLDVRVVDTDYSSFAVVYIYKELEGALSTMVQLYRAPALPQAGPKKRVPKSWRPSRTSTRRWGCQRTWWPCCPSQMCASRGTGTHPEGAGDLALPRASRSSRFCHPESS